MKRSGLIWGCPVMVFVLATACGGSTPPPEQPKPEPTLAPPPPPPEPEPVAEEEPEPEPVEEPKQPRRPLATYNNPSGPVTVGFDGAVIRLSSGGELRIPGGAMNIPRNVAFRVDKKFRGGKGKAGDVYMIEVQIPDRKYDMNVTRPSQPFPSGGDNFVLKLPLPQGKDSANLAVETVEIDDKSRTKSSWIVVAQTKLETADTGNKAVFEMAQLPDAHVHLTTQEAGSTE